MGRENENINPSEIEEMQSESTETFTEDAPTIEQYATEPARDELESFEAAGEEMLNKMEIADTRLDIEGMSRYGEAWDKAKGWAKKGWNWAKQPSTTYPEAIGKAALFSAGTTVFLAPVFLLRNCNQVYQARKKDQLGNLSYA